MLSNCINLGLPWQSMCLSEVICRFRARCQSFSACSRMRRLALPILNAPAGSTGLSVLVAARSANLTVSPRAQAYYIAGNAAAIRALAPAPSWSARTHRFRFGSGRLIWSPVRHQVYRLFSSSGNSDCRATRLPSRFFTSCASAWCGWIRTESGRSLVSMLRLTKPMWADAKPLQWFCQ